MSLPAAAVHATHAERAHRVALARRRAPAADAGQADVVAVDRAVVAAGTVPRLAPIASLPRLGELVDDALSTKNRTRWALRPLTGDRAAKVLAIVVRHARLHGRAVRAAKSLTRVTEANQPKAVLRAAACVPEARGRRSAFSGVRCHRIGGSVSRRPRASASAVDGACLSRGATVVTANKRQRICFAATPQYQTPNQYASPHASTVARGATSAPDGADAQRGYC